MSKYLSIGQVAQIKGINVKSLRYYDKIGIFKPAYIDANTGYRYYEQKQLLYIDFIQFLVDLDIPLKNWWFYFNNENEFDLDKLLFDGQRIAHEKINSIQRNLQRIEMAADGILDVEQYANSTPLYKRYIPERHYLYKELDFEPTPTQFQSIMSQLFTLSRVLDVASNFPAGILLDHAPKCDKFVIFVRVYEPIPDCPNYRHIPSGYYNCVITEPKTIYRLNDHYPDIMAKYDTATIIEEDFIERKAHVETPLVELQFPVIKNDD